MAGRAGAAPNDGARRNQPLRRDLRPGTVDPLLLVIVFIVSSTSFVGLLAAIVFGYASVAADPG